MNRTENKTELKELAQYLSKVADVIPQGLATLKDAVLFAALDINVFNRFGVSKGLEKALTFAKSIPKVTDMNDPILIDWMIHDAEYLKYWEPPPLPSTT